MSIFTKKGITSKSASLSRALLLSALTLSTCAGSAMAQGKNTDLEVFGGGLTKSNPQGFSVGQGYGNNPNSGAFTIKKDALEQVTWFKSRRQVSIEDDGPIVTDRRTGGFSSNAGARGALSPATFGGSNALGGALSAPRNLQQAQFGPMTRPERPQARPIMHGGQLASPGKLAASNSAQTPAARPAAQANYGGYNNAPAAMGDYGSSSAHIREVKARLLGGH